MNNGQPPYGPYGQPGYPPQGQNLQQPQGYPPQPYQPYQGYTPAQGPAEQPPVGYPPQYPGYQQPIGYPPQNQGTPQPQQGYPYPGDPQQAQMYQQPQMYQQQGHQPQTYQQQNWQPYGQQPAQPQAYAQPVQYPQYNQQGQPVYPQQGFSGYVSQPQQQKKKAVPAEVLAKVMLFGVLPVLFVLGLVLGSLALKWVFLAAAVAGIIGMWLVDAVSPNMRLTLSLVYGALAVVALVSALNGPVPDQTNPADPSGAAMQQTVGQPDYTGGTAQQSATDVPTATPSLTPEAATEGAAAEQLRSFLYFWSTNNQENMLALTAPSWRASFAKPTEELWRILSNRTPDQDWEITMSGTDNDTQRTARVKVTIDKHIKDRPKDRYSFKIIMLKEDGVWYVDPRSLESHDKETPTPATVNTTATQPPQITGYPDMPLYYNPDKGSYYHRDPNCDEVGKKYRPLQGVFYFRQLGEEPYNQLEACGPCGAPLPD